MNLTLLPCFSLKTFLLLFLVAFGKPLLSQKESDFNPSCPVSLGRNIINSISCHFYEVKKNKYLYLFKKEAQIIKVEQVVLVFQRQVLQNIYESLFET